MKRTKKNLETMLETYIKMTLDGQVVIEIPLEAFYHLQNFFKGQIPLDFQLPGNSSEVVTLDGGCIGIKAPKTKRISQGIKRPRIRPLLR